jgi:hypothetical protein
MKTAFLDLVVILKTINLGLGQIILSTIVLYCNVSFVYLKEQSNSSLLLSAI